MKMWQKWFEISFANRNLSVMTKNGKSVDGKPKSKLRKTTMAYRNSFLHIAARNRNEQFSVEKPTRSEKKERIYQKTCHYEMTFQQSIG